MNPFGASERFGCNDSLEFYNVNPTRKVKRKPEMVVTFWLFTLGSKRSLVNPFGYRLIGSLSLVNAEVTADHVIMGSEGP